MIIPLFVSFKGCPHRCLFCNQPIINGTAYHGVEDVKSQLRTLAGWSERTIAMSLLFMAVPSQPFRWRNRKPCWNLSCLIVRLAILRTYAFPPGLMP